MNCRPESTEQMLIDFFDAVDHQMAILELEGDTLIFNRPNRSLADLLKVPAEDLHCRPVEDVVELDDPLKRWVADHKGDATASDAFTFECRLRSKSPEIWLECRISSMPGRSSDSAFFSFVAMDITKRKHAQEELGHVKNRLYDIIDLGTDNLETTTESLKLIVDKIPVMICCYDDSGRILYVNRAFEDIIGWSLSEARRIDLMATCYPDPDVRDRAQAFMRSDRSDWEDFPLRRRSGDVLDTSWTNVALTRTIRIGIGIDITQRKRAEEALRRLSRNTLEMLENDRQSVAKELHDSIGASLAAIKFSLEGRVSTMGNPPTGGELPIETIIGYLAETIKESKRISNGLRPLTLDDLGLLPTLIAYIRQLRESYPDVEISQSVDLKESDIPDAMKIVLYRVAQEALNNIHKHSRATRAALRLKRKVDIVELTVEDNGCGFDIGAVLEGEDPLMGYGLRSMKERVEIRGGSFRIRSAHGAGTTIVAAMPLG